tara:strand:- start:3501 stop:3968 length:468 start_codon:yes stop_codon:yes gene_type:complete
MSKLYKKSPFRVPNDYFIHFDKNMNQRISSTNSRDGFKIPSSYFQKLEDQILSKISYSKGINIFISEKFWRLMALTAILTLYFLNEKIDREQTELADFFIENYLNENTTYEIADHSDYYFETSSFIENYESIALEDAMETRLFGETPTNLNLFYD